MTPRDVWLLDTTAIGRRVLVYDRLESTNTLAAELANSPDREQLAILADEQTAGRGQHGRTWTAVPGSSVLLSLLLFPPDFLRRPPILTAWAAVSVCLTIHKLTGFQATIKWPNDVLVDGKKVCGILIEQGRGTVVGIGLNVRQTPDDFATAGLIATSLNQIAATSFGAEPVARSLLQMLDAEFERLCAGDRDTLQTGWTKHLGLLGKQVVAECPNIKYSGRLSEITFAEVAIEPPGGPLLVLRPEQVLHLDAVPLCGTAQQ
jgi:BirA family biotin operon repressor/biotin-[acetyl-CoA-carboxylase] ligase